MKCYSGKNLRVNLSDQIVSVEEQPEKYYKFFLGGSGFIASTLIKELPPGIDPFGADNKLIFSLGPLTGSRLIGSGRHSVGGKSPLTGGFAESEAGGFWGAELRRAGFDFIIVEGISQKPVYLWIKDGQVEIRSAAHLWGLGTADTEKRIQDELDNQKVRVACIGPGAENLVRYACIAHDVTHMAGRNGLGAVMGSKRLKAIAVKGSGTPEAHDQDTVRDLSRWMGRNFKIKSSHWQCGTGSAMISYEKSGNTPVNNFRGGRFPGVSRITPQHIMEQDYLIKMEGCYNCPIKCRRKVQVPEPWEVDSIYGSPEYETLAAFGSNCGIDQVEALIKVNKICNDNGIDTISTGVCIAFAMECFENNLLSKEDTEGLELKFGNADAMVAMAEKIAHRKGLGDILAEGVQRAADRIGDNASRYAMHVKGCEIPMHEPRGKQGLALHYSVHANGPDHCAGVHDDRLASNVGTWDSIDVAESLESVELSPGKARMLYQMGLWSQVVNYLGLCIFVPWTNKQKCDAVEAVTGWPMSYWRLMKTVERGTTLARIFNLREGFSLSNDTIPQRFFTSPLDGPLQNISIDINAHTEARELYYQMLGWDKDGIPTHARLVELGIEWAEQYMIFPT